MPDLQLRGTISWPGFGKHGEDWLGFLFVIPRFTRRAAAAQCRRRRWSGSTSSASCDLPLWEGDRHFLPLVFDADPRPFHGVMPYRDGRMVSWTYSR